MSLPPITMPSSLPAFLSDEHSIDMLPSYSDVPRTTGHSRRRRLFTGNVPRIVNVTLDLTDDQMIVFNEWYETTLLVAERPFSVQVAEQGPGLLWWASLWAEPPTREAIDGGGWKVTGKLRLTGRGSATPPPETSMEAAVAVYILGSAAPLVGKPLVAAVTVPFVEPSAVSHSGAGHAAGVGTALGHLVSTSLAAGAAAGVATVLGRARVRGSAAGVATVTGVSV